MIAYIEAHKDEFVQCQTYDRKNENGFQEGSILKSLAFTDDGKHLVAGSKGWISVYTLNGWEELKLFCQVQLNTNEIPILSTANNAVDSVAIYLDSSK